MTALSHRRPIRRVSRLVASCAASSAVVLIVSVLFFVIPLVWLLLATDQDRNPINVCNSEHPFTFGSFAQLRGELGSRS